MMMKLSSELIDEGKAERYDSRNLSEHLFVDLENDLEILQQIKRLWVNIKRDPKLMKLLDSFRKIALLTRKQNYPVHRIKRDCGIS